MEEQLNISLFTEVAKILHASSLVNIEVNHVVNSVLDVSLGSNIRNDGLIVRKEQKVIISQIVHLETGELRPASPEAVFSDANNRKLMLLVTHVELHDSLRLVIEHICVHRRIRVDRHIDIVLERSDLVEVRRVGPQGSALLILHGLVLVPRNRTTEHVSVLGLHRLDFLAILDPTGLKLELGLVEMTNGFNFLRETSFVLLLCEMTSR